LESFSKYNLIKEGKFFLMKYRVDRLDLIILACLVLGATFFALNFVNFSAPPIEDAAMLMRYADHFAHGYGIVWNIGDAPVDGATDFLFMVILGVFVKAGLSVEFATRFLGFSAHILTIWVVYLALRYLFHAPVPVAAASAAYLIFGTGFYYVAAYFGTTVFALSACITWYLALELCQTEDSHLTSLLFAISALVTGLIRPEGVILASLMLLTIICIKGIKASRFTIFYFLAVFFLIGGSYMLWRWGYFGYPLPNPYYKKGGGKIYPDSFQISMIYTLGFCLPLLPAYFAGLFYKKTFRKTIGFLLPIVGFASAFILLSNEMNVRGRFQYALLPIALMVWWPLLDGIREHLRLTDWKAFDNPRRVVALASFFVLSVGAMGYLNQVSSFTNFRDGKYDVSLMLSSYKDKGFTIMASEAGLLPFYSHWRALDPWGLNDKWIAHHGTITEEYIRSFNPHVIMFHANFLPFMSPDSAVKSPQWNEMIMLLKTYAEKNGYILAGAFSESTDYTEYYYVRSDFPESAEIVRRIKNTVYHSNTSGKIDKNYALP
jgi:arabinofuranosyltransferase